MMKILAIVMILISASWAVAADIAAPSSLKSEMGRLNVRTAVILPVEYWPGLPAHHQDSKPSGDLLPR